MTEQPTHVQCFIGVPDPLADTVRGHCIALIGEDNGGGMLKSAYSPTGTAPATHRVSSGLIEVAFWDMLQTPEALAAAIGVPVEDAAHLLSVCTVSGEPGAVVLAEMGLLPVNEESALL